MHGGFENETPNIPTATIMKVDTITLFKNAPTLLTKLEAALGQSKGGNVTPPGSRTPGSTQSSSDA